MISTTRRLGALLLVAVLVIGCASSAAPSTGGVTAPPAATATPAPTGSPTGAPEPSGAPPNPPASASPSLSPSVAPPPATGGKAVLASDVDRAATKSADAKAGAKAVNAFAVDLYRRMTKEGRNLVFSPTSIMLALSMVRPGARGETATQIDDVMHDAATDAHAAWMNGLERALRKRTATYQDEEGTARKVVLRIANAAFLQRGYPFEQAYLDALAQRFGAGIRLADFRADPAGSRRTINVWVKKQTSGRIPSLLNPDDVKPATRFALVNAIYLKAAWLNTFSPEETVSAPFRLANGTRIRVPTMVGPHDMRWLHYATGTGWRAAELPYIGEKLAMTVILPDDIAAFEKAMTPKRLEAIVTRVADAPIFHDCGGDCSVAWKIELPKFSIETRTLLNKALAAAGMPLAFDPLAANLTGIVDPANSGEGALFLSRAIHKANIDVDEKGTTAAASTAFLGEAGGGPETKYFKVNRPFIFVLRDVPTGAILFMGRVMDPSAR